MRGPAFLIRHGEVENPDGLVYADLPGFPLSGTGKAQAQAASRHLEEHGLARIVSSPVQRALQTAEIVAGPHELAVVVDDRLTEWRLSSHWAGLPWAGLPELRPGELEAYLDRPWDLPFSPESLAVVAARMRAVIEDHLAAGPGAVAFVSHQDPVQAARLLLTGRPLSMLHHDKPGHASILMLQPGDPWSEVSYWEP